jgi:hypothetical protein
MVVVAMVVFFLSLLGIAALFALKYWELRREHVVAPALREKVDARADKLKELMSAARTDASKLPPALVRLARFMVHELALGFAALARLLERQAHRLADMVSYKHRFERRETRSEFLKKVAEHKNGGGQSNIGNSSPELDESAD